MRNDLTMSLSLSDNDKFPSCWVVSPGEPIIMKWLRKPPTLNRQAVLFYEVLVEGVQPIQTVPYPEALAAVTRRLQRYR